MRTFGQVPLALWRDPRFVALSTDAMTAVLFMWCGPHSTSAGIYVLLDGYAAIDLNWQLERWVAAREEVEKYEFIHRDPVSQTILVIDYFVANRPSNARHLAAIRNQIASLNCASLREEAERALAVIVPTPTNSQGMPPRLETPYMQRRS